MVHDGTVATDNFVHMHPNTNTHGDAWSVHMNICTDVLPCLNCFMIVHALVCEGLAGTLQTWSVVTVFWYDFERRLMTSLQDISNSNLHIRLQLENKSILGFRGCNMWVVTLLLPLAAATLGINEYRVQEELSSNVDSMILWFIIRLPGTFMLCLAWTLSFSVKANLMSGTQFNLKSS